jgi:hypothetical protein
MNERHDLMFREEGSIPMVVRGRVRLSADTGPTEPSLNPWTSGFWLRLFDLTFRTFITPQIITVVFVIGMLIEFGAVVFGLVVALTNGFWAFIWALIFSPVVLVVGVVILRVWMEVLIVLFTIAGGVVEVANNTRPKTSPVGADDD